MNFHNTKRHCRAARLSSQLLARALSTSALSTAVLVAGLSAVGIDRAHAAQQSTSQAAEEATTEEIVVTGSRIVREGYEAPTPMTVIGAEVLATNAEANIAQYLVTIPALVGSGTTGNRVASLGPGSGGVNDLNLRGLGANRTLVLLDGQRVVGSLMTGVVDINSFPQQLISRIDVVTGGASAVYGSDAVAGVVNFILDREYTGLKGEVSGGMTNYGDEENYKFSLTGGFGFAGGRGHVLLSGEWVEQMGTDGDGGREWNRESWLQMSNPNYTATGGQPAQLWLPGVGNLGIHHGGIITSGPLKGIFFGEGGVPGRYTYGDLQANPNMRGGDWRSSSTRHLFPLAVPQKRANLFTRVSYDITDNLNAFLQYSGNMSDVDAPFINIFMNTGPLIQIDNAFIPQSVRTAMVASGVTNFRIGTLNSELGLIRNDTRRYTNRYNGGLNGSFDAFDSEWNWDAYAGYGLTRIALIARNNISTARYLDATDAVIDTRNGGVVCRSTLTNPSNGCSPWNPLGTSVNANYAAGLTYLRDESYQKGSIEQTVFAASVSGDPFSNWAGPVSIALSVEHRKDAVHLDVDPGSAITDHPFGVYGALHGEQSVSEIAAETVVPLANGTEWADSWDLNAAARFTDYSLAGSVATWKIGTTYSPVSDLRFRVTRSRDIRAPNAQELFAASGSTRAAVFDPVTNTNPLARLITRGNLSLTPEKADALGVGVVVQPSFFEGFSASVDYWRVDISSAIQSLGHANVVSLCVTGQRPDLCPSIVRFPDGTIDTVTANPINLAKVDVRGVDVEGSYRMPLSSLTEALDGDIFLHANATFYLDNIIDTGITAPTNRVGENAGNNPPNWKASTTLQYDLEPFTASLTARGFSSGVINATYIECTSGCPTSTALATTINSNQLPGAWYWDASLNYKINVADAVESQLFMSVKNIFNKDPTPTPNTFYMTQSSGGPYDNLGTVFRVGMRFRM